ncbi:MAG: hypothetical protein HF982_01430 [Desulfobacteraceae bacterium]|nr:hypothetical protein [Desulfobacteraceae bacterium]MBC2718259.1 hypothetical protein [Desulfobacteraceae bacterium]
MERHVEYIFGYPVTTIERNACVKQILSWIDSNQRGKYFVCTNPHSIAEAESDPIFKKALKSADLIIPDGKGDLPNLYVQTCVKPGRKGDMLPILSAS